MPGDAKLASDLAALNCYLLFQTLVEQLVIFI